MASGSDLVPLYYVAGIALAGGTGLWAVRAWLHEQRRKWTSEGAREANLDQTLKENTKAAHDNTTAIDNLATKFGELSAAIRELRTTQNGHGEILASLQQWRRDHLRQHEPD